MKTFIIFSAALAVLLTGCGSGVVVGSGRVRTESRSVSNFRAVSLSGFGDMTITQGDVESLTVEADDNLLPYVVTEVRNGTLHVSMERPVSTRNPINYSLSVKNLESLDLSGAGRIVSGDLKSDKLTVRVSGAGSIELGHVEASNVTSTLSGVGSLRIGGQVASQTTNLSGVGGYHAGNLSSKTARINVSGTGGATVWAQDSLDVTISGVGSVSYYGTPHIDRTLSGVGALRSLGVRAD